MEKKHIIIIGPAYPFRGGIASSNERLALALQTLGHQVEMYTYTTQYPKWIFPGKSQFTNKAKPASLSIHRKFSSINPISWMTLRNEINRIKPDLIIDRFWLPYLGAASAYLLNESKLDPAIKCLSIVDNYIPHQKMFGDRFFMNRFMKSHENYVVMSSSVLKEIKDEFPNKNIHLIPHPVYDNYGNMITKAQACEKLGLSTDKNYLLFFGFIKPYKGLDLLLDSIDLEYFRKNNLHLIIAGEVYGDPGRYRQIIKEANLSDVLSFYNQYIPDEVVKYYFCASDLIVQTYLSATQSGISQLAIHYEKAVLVTDVGGLSEMIIDGETGYVVPKNKSAIMDAIRDFFDKGKQNHFSDQIKKIKAENTWEAFGSKLLNFIFRQNEGG